MIGDSYGYTWIDFKTISGNLAWINFRAGFLSLSLSLSLSHTHTHTHTHTNTPSLCLNIPLTVKTSVRSTHSHCSKWQTISLWHAIESFQFDPVLKWFETKHTDKDFLDWRQTKKQNKKKTTTTTTTTKRQTNKQKNKKNQTKQKKSLFTWSALCSDEQSWKSWDVATPHRKLKQTGERKITKRNIRSKVVYSGVFSWWKYLWLIELQMLINNTWNHKQMSSKSFKNKVT